MATMWHKLPAKSNGASRYITPFLIPNIPPLLVQGIVLRNKWRGIPVEKKLTGKIDTAASVTTIPDVVADELKFPSAGAIDNIKGFDHSIQSKPYPLVQVEIFIPQWGWKNMSVMVCPRNNILLGRDICEEMLLFVNWRSGFGMRTARFWHRPFELYFKSLIRKKM